MQIKYKTEQKDGIEWKNTTFCKQLCWNIEKILKFAKLYTEEKICQITKRNTKINTVL